MYNFIVINKINKKMNFEIFFQLIALFFVLSAGPLLIVLVASRGGNI